MKKMDTQFQTPTKKLCQGTQWSPQEHHERRNPASNHWEFHGDVTRHGQAKHTGGTQEFQKYEKTQK
jgi:hypothetical protein